MDLNSVPETQAIYYTHLFPNVGIYFRKKKGEETVLSGDSRVNIWNIFFPSCCSSPRFLPSVLSFFLSFSFLHSFFLSFFFLSFNFYCFSSRSFERHKTQVSFSLTPNSDHFPALEPVKGHYRGPAHASAHASVRMCSANSPAVKPSITQDMMR